MALGLDEIRFLRSERASEALRDYADADLSASLRLPLLTTLRKTFSVCEAAAIMTTLQLRQSASGKFPHYASRMLFTAAALQQASQPLARRYRAGLIESATVLDLCCGIGADSLAFAAADRQVLGLDIDPARIAMARHNAEVMGSTAEFRVADVRQGIPGGFDCLFYDPARRDRAGRRIHHVERYQPPLSLVRGVKAREIIVKLSPGVDLRQLADYGGHLEFISIGGQLREALLWLHQPFSPPSATLLSDGGSLRMRNRGIDEAPVTAPRAWLLEPDAAVLRASLVRQLAHELDASLLDTSIAYLTADRLPETAWARAWRIIDWMPFQLKRLRRYLVERGVGQITVKKRGFAMSPQDLISRLRLKRGHETRVLVMTRHKGKPIAIICADQPFG